MAGNEKIKFCPLDVVLTFAEKMSAEKMSLLKAAESGDIEQMSQLLDNADLAIDIDACEHGQLFCANDKLFFASSELRGCDFSACHVAILGRQFAALKFLVERGACISKSRFCFAHTSGHPVVPLLVLAAEHGGSQAERMTIYLLEAGATLEHVNPIRLVIFTRSVAVMLRLQSRGVDFSALRNEIGGTLLHSMIREIMVTTYLADDVKILHDAVTLLNVDINARDQYGRTVFKYLNACDRIDVIVSNDSFVRTLVELGADIDIADYKGETALSCSIRYSNLSKTRLLLALGADIDGNHNVLRKQLSSDIVAHLLAVHKFDFCSLKLPIVHPEYVDETRRNIARTRLDFVRGRALEVCIGLQPLNLNALQMCEIMMHSCGACSSLIRFHQWWSIATAVKHYRSRLS